MPKENDTPNYTEAQEQIIRDYAAKVGRPLNFEDAKAIAADPAMNHPVNGVRKARSIVAKVTRMDDVSYKAKEPTRKDGSEIAKKAELVKRIAENAGIALATLEGLDKAPRDALVALTVATTPPPVAVGE